MLIDQSGISLGEDALSTYYSVPSDTNSSVPTESKSLTTRSSSPERKDPMLLRLRNWLGFGQKNRNPTNENTETVEKIMECFRSNDIPAMDKFMVPETADTKEKEEFWWDDEVNDPADSEDVTEFIPSRNRKNTPHLNKVLPTLPPQVRKCVKFDLDLENTPEDKKTRPFTPLFTSTPKNVDGYVASDESDDEIVPLHYCDSNTVAAPRPVLNNTSSILLTNTSIMGSWHKTRHQTDHALNLALNPGRASDYYRTCFDADDEETNEEKQEAVPSPANTFVIARNSPEACSDSESGEKTMSSDENLQHEENDLSTDSSVVLELDRLEDYIRNLDTEMAECRQFATRGDMNRARGALQNAQCLQERISQMSEAITEMCEKLQHSEDHERQVTAAFEDSCWAAQLDVECGSFDDQL